MKRLAAGLGILLLFALPMVALTPTAAAQFDPFEDVCQGSAADAEACSADGSNNPIAGPDGVLTRAIEILSYVAGVAAVIMIIIGGLKFITANGDPNSISSARNTVIYALIGVAVFATSQLIVRFVISRL